MSKKQKIRPGRLAFALGMILFLPAAAAAATIPVDALVYSGFDPSLHVNVDMGIYTPVDTRAGSANLELTVTADTFWTGQYLGFCVEAEPVYKGTYYTYELEDVTGAYVYAAYLMSKYFDPSASDHEMASLQVAIWEAVLDATGSGPGTDISNGNFAYNSGGLNSADLALVNTMLTDVASADLDGFSTEGYKLVKSEGVQDFIIYKAVPVPSALLLLGSGLIGFIGLRRKLAARR